MSRFRLDKSTEQDGWYVLTDTENMIVYRFQEHRFNETQRVTFLDETIHNRREAHEIARMLREAGDYLFSHWYSIAMPTPVFEFRQDDENDRLLILRNKFPRLEIEIKDKCDMKQLSDALKAAGEFVFKYRNQYGRS